jgi:hypothetical protein
MRVIHVLREFVAPESAAGIRLAVDSIAALTLGIAAVACLCCSRSTAQVSLVSHPVILISLPRIPVELRG